MVFVHLTIWRMQGGARRISPRHMFLVMSKDAFEDGARLLCLSIHRKLKVILLMQKSDPRDVIAYTRGGGKGGGDVDYIITYGGDVRIVVIITEVNESLFLV